MLPSHDTLRLQDWRHIHYYYLNTRQCPAAKLFSCWEWSCKTKQYIMASYMSKEPPPPSPMKPKIKPIIFNSRQPMNLNFSRQAKNNHRVTGFYFLLFPPSFLLTFANSKIQSQKKYMYLVRSTSVTFLLTYSKGKASGIHHTSIKPLSNT